MNIYFVHIEKDASTTELQLSLLLAVTVTATVRVAVWRNGNALLLINEVNLR